MSVKDYLSLSQVSGCRIQDAGYRIQGERQKSLSLSLQPREKVVILRHDVDRKPENALKMAEIERDFDIQATYYFRSTKEVFKAEIMHEIGKMGHEVGYHYEVLDKAKGNYVKAIRNIRGGVERVQEDL